jgi:hypothetical protein
MSKFAIRLLTLAMYATALVAVPMVTPAKAAADSSKVVKKKKNAGNLRINTAKPSSSAWPPMYDDPDRKASGGGY